MALIHLNVEGHDITCTDESKAVLSQGSHNIDTVSFTYDSTYQGYTLYATMYQHMGYPVIVELESDSCTIPVDALLYPGKVYIGLRAVNSAGTVVATSGLVWFEVRPGAIDGSEGTPSTGMMELIRRMIAEIGGGGEGDSVPTAVKQAIATLFSKGVYTEADISDEISIVQSWVGIVVPVSGLTLNHNALNVYTGHTKTVTATVTPINASDQTIQWSSSDLSVATISVSGKTATITGVANGSAIITATTRDGGYLGTCTVTVAEAVPESVTITGVEPSISSGTQFTVTATVTPAEAPDKTLTWRSSNTSVATVTPSSDTMSCTVSCIAEGTTTITATTNVGNVSASFTIDVANGHLAPITPTLLNKAYTYAYVADTKAGIDTSDTSTIINFGNCRRYLVFDCRGMSKIRIEKYADDNLYMANLGVQAIYAFNSAPVAMNQVSPPSSSDTTQAAYKLVSTIASNSTGSLETYYKIDDYDIDQNYPYVVIVAPKNLTTGSSFTVAEDAVLSDFTKTTDTYTTVSHWCVRVSEIQGS